LKIEYKYASHYCEENIWHLCGHPDFRRVEKKVLIISNGVKKVYFHHHQDFPVAWDYHVIMAVRSSYWQIYDLDSTLPLPCPIEQYLSKTFMEANTNHQSRPEFLVIDAAQFVEGFSSDRSHMKQKDGTWIATPPEWPIISNNDPRFDLKFLKDFENHGSKILNMEQLKEIFN